MILYSNNNCLEKKSKYRNNKTEESFKISKNLNKNNKQIIENDKYYRAKADNYNNMHFDAKIGINLWEILFPEMLVKQFIVKIKNERTTYRCKQKDNFNFSKDGKKKKYHNFA